MRHHITLEGLSEHLDSISKEEWNRLFAFIPRIEETPSFGEWEKIGNYPYYMPSALVDEFQSYLYKIGLIVDFNWPRWEEGARLYRDPKSDYMQCPPLTLVKLLTAIVRSNRFVEGVLVTAFEDGKILQILKGLRVYYGVGDEIGSG